MSVDIGRPFESIESAHEFIILLEESVAEAIAEVNEHLASVDGAESGDRQNRALGLALYKLNQLSNQMNKSRRALNDLRTIRNLLLTERAIGRGA
jgi:hypothetical protein